jgi:predicted MFS family arabinose efflux permease
MHHTPSLPAINERHLILLVGLVQFVNILDFMMVMPLGPDFAAALGIPTSDIGEIGGAYTFAAAISGLACALFLDKYARKKALLFCLAGLITATFCGAFVWDSNSMIAARLLAGAFGGPLSSLSIAMIADYIPPERRGAAMGKVMGSHSAASILGVPFGLELAQHVSWRAPFVTTAILGLAIAVLAYAKLPYHPAHAYDASLRNRVKGLLDILSSPLALVAYGMMMCAMMAGFMIIPNISAHVQMNLEYPRAHLGLLYLCGGAISFFSMRFAGRMIDRTSSTHTVLLFSAGLLVSLATGFIWYGPVFPVLPVFILFMVSMTGRTVSVQTLSSKIPKPSQRGAYMSIQSAVMHVGSALGAYIPSHILVEKGGKLLHLSTVGMMAAALSLVVPVLCWWVEKRVKTRAPEPTVTPPPVLMD